MEVHQFSDYELDIKQYKKCKRINRGGFGTIYEVQNKETGKFFAAKVIDCGDDKDQCQKIIEREVGILMLTNHPTIIKFIGYSNIDFLEENNITIIMQFAKNGSLSDVLQKVRNFECPANYTNTTRQIILIGIARGMKYLHDRNIIHRDLKTGNILLDDNFHPLITDFGLSKIFESGHSFSQTLFGGTLPYMAPEIIKNEPYDRKVDVYAFGILMFEVVTDTASYPEIEGKKISEFEFLYKVSDKNYRPKFEVPVNEKMKELIEQCWSNNPDERPTFEEILNKLTSKDEKEACRFDDIDDNEVELYIEDVTEVKSSGDKLLKRIELIEKGNSEVREANEKLLKENEELKEQLSDLKGSCIQQEERQKKLEERQKKLEERQERLEEENKALVNENSVLKAKHAEIASLFASDANDGGEVDIASEVKRLQSKAGEGEKKDNTKREPCRSKSEDKPAKIIIVAGYNYKYGVNTTRVQNFNIIKVNLDPSSLLSFSIGDRVSVAITKKT